mmetsp:Transcript_21580/g.54491  ORF Transcript_21580/g.54491 Transcript_21580/m.54491 type:complete len:245 (-) Transcript_21580:218-952(-)|eukprot:CAMPEP_0178988374 /NCGR_PEP_ID=MMETSP0795-20121207/3776_1 /TAXON_ID=88552 /ORGANISM="Amoebophrya sp., Strain Ameob2" /LENGTH=244 /DNA_ID=CAMNT_0020679643 /DNA_START=117 /DNA_END=851 /DNA_ORIENTATION=-
MKIISTAAIAFVIAAILRSPRPKTPFDMFDTVIYAPPTNSTLANSAEIAASYIGLQQVDVADVVATPDADDVIAPKNSDAQPVVQLTAAELSDAVERNMLQRTVREAVSKLTKTSAGTQSAKTNLLVPGTVKIFVEDASGPTDFLAPAALDAFNTTKVLDAFADHGFFRVAAEVDEKIGGEEARSGRSVTLKWSIQVDDEQGASSPSPSVNDTNATATNTTSAIFQAEEGGRVFVGLDGTPRDR